MPALEIMPQCPTHEDLSEQNLPVVRNEERRRRRSIGTYNSATVDTNRTETENEHSKSENGLQPEGYHHRRQGFSGLPSRKEAASRLVRFMGKRLQMPRSNRKKRENQIKQSKISVPTSSSSPNQVVDELNKQHLAEKTTELTGHTIAASSYLKTKSVSASSREKEQQTFTRPTNQKTMLEGQADVDSKSFYSVGLRYWPIIRENTVEAPPELFCQDDSEYASSSTLSGDPLDQLDIE